MPSVTEIDPIRQALAALSPGDPVRHGPLTMVPLLAPGAEDPGWLTLAEAGDAVTVTESSDGGAVPFLKVTNGADRPVLLLDGEELVGAKQNRVLNTTVLAAARAATVIPVSCVEEGRWAYRSRGFASAGTTLFASLRAKKAARVTESLRRGGEHRGNQGEVWQDIADRSAAHSVESPTGAMHAVYERYAGEVDAARSALAAGADQVGALVFLGARWVGLELLASPPLFRTAWPRLCAGYAADAIGTGGTSEPGESVEAILARIGAAAVEPARAPGLGEELRLIGGQISGAALTVENRVAHLAAFPAAAED
jgi:hypothetical protein